MKIVMDNFLPNLLINFLVMKKVLKSIILWYLVEIWLNSKQCVFQKNCGTWKFLAYLLQLLDSSFMLDYRRKSILLRWATLFQRSIIWEFQTLFQNLNSMLNKIAYMSLWRNCKDCNHPNIGRSFGNFLKFLKF